MKEEQPYSIPRKRKENGRRKMEDKKTNKTVNLILAPKH